MSKWVGYVVVGFLAVLTAMTIYRSYFHKWTPPKYDYSATEVAKIDLASLQSAGLEGWDCAFVAEAEPHRYLVICKRPLP